MTKFPTLSKAVEAFTEKNPKVSDSYFDSAHRKKLNILGTKVYCQKTAKGWELVKLNRLHLIIRRFFNLFGFKLYKGIEAKELKNAFQKETGSCPSSKKAAHLYNALLNKFGQKEAKKQTEKSPSRRKSSQKPRAQGKDPAPQRPPQRKLNSTESKIIQSSSFTQTIQEMPPEKVETLINEVRDQRALSFIWKAEKELLVQSPAPVRNLPQIRRLEKMFKAMDSEQLFESAQTLDFILLLNTYVAWIEKNKEEQGYSSQMVNFTKEAFTALARGNEAYFQNTLKILEKDLSSMTDHNPAQDNLSKSFATIIGILAEKEEASLADKLEAITAHTTPGLGKNEIQAKVQPLLMTNPLLKKDPDQKQRIRENMQASFKKNTGQLEAFNTKMHEKLKRNRKEPQPSPPPKTSVRPRAKQRPLPRQASVKKVDYATWTKSDFEKDMGTFTSDKVQICKTFLSGDFCPKDERVYVAKKMLGSAMFQQEVLPKLDGKELSKLVRLTQDDPGLIDTLWIALFGAQSRELEPGKNETLLEHFQTMLFALSDEQFDRSLPDPNFRQLLERVPSALPELQDARFLKILTESEKEYKNEADQPLLMMISHSIPKMTEAQLILVSEHFVPDHSGHLELNLRTKAQKISNDAKNKIIQNIKERLETYPPEETGKNFFQNEPL